MYVWANVSVCKRFSSGAKSHQVRRTILKPYHILPHVYVEWFFSWSEVLNISFGYREIGLGYVTNGTSIDIAITQPISKIVILDIQIDLFVCTLFKSLGWKWEWRWESQRKKLTSFAWVCERCVYTIFAVQIFLLMRAWVCTAHDRILFC